MNSGKLNSYFGEGTVLKGTLRFKGLLRFDGSFEGEVISPDTFIVGESGDVKANIKTGEFFNYGAVTGDVEAQRKISLHNNSRLVGNVNAPSIALEEGSFFEGSCKMPPPPPRAATPKKTTPKADVSRDTVVMPSGLGQEMSFKFPMKKIGIGAAVALLVAGVWLLSGRSSTETTVAEQPAVETPVVEAEPKGPSLDDLRKEVAQNPASEEARLALANELIDTGSLVEGVAALREASSALPASDTVRLLLANTLQRAGREADALKEYQAYANNHADATDSGLNKAFEAMERGSLAVALKGFEEALASEPDNLRARLGLATVYSKREENDKAVAECRTILDSLPDYAPALNRLAWLLAKQEKNLQKAKELSERSMAYYDDIPEYIDTLSEVNYRMGNYDTAVELIKKAVKLVPSDPYYKRQLFKFQRASR